MLETVAEYGREQLALAGELPTVQARHAAYVLALAEEAEIGLRGAEQGIWLARLEADLDNCRAALAWSQAEPGRAELGLRLAGALGFFWFTRGHLTEAGRWLESMLGLNGATPGPVRAKALNGLGGLVWAFGDHDRAGLLHTEALSLARQHGDRWTEGWALVRLGHVSWSRAEYDDAVTVLEQGAAVYRDLDDHWGLSVALSRLGEVRMDQERYADAALLFEELLPLHRTTGDVMGTSHTLYRFARAVVGLGDRERAVGLLEESRAVTQEYGLTRTHARVLHFMGLLAQDQDDPERADALLQESLAKRQAMVEKEGIAECLEGLAGLAASTREPERAAILFGAAATLRAALGAPIPPSLRRRVLDQARQTRVELGEQRFAELSARGEALSLEQAVAYAQVRA
jgi:tetratricopeptide (TPR) repeat protein